MARFPNHGVEDELDAKPDSCTERRDVDPTGISVKVSAQYPGRSGGSPLGYRRREARGRIARSQQRP